MLSKTEIVANPANTAPKQCRIEQGSKGVNRCLKQSFIGQSGAKMQSYRDLQRKN